MSMFKVYCNGKLLHDSKMQSLRISNAKVELELGKTGLFDFTIYPDHPYYDEIFLMLSLVSVLRNDKTIFSGRVLTISYGFHNEKRVSCEGDLAFLCDTIVEPLAFYGSFVEYAERLVRTHNAQVDSTKQFTLGNFSAADFYPFEVVTNDYFRTLDEINTRIIGQSGCYLQTRTENGVRYLDVLSYDVNISNTSNQSITYGKNLIDIQREVDGTEVFSSIYPIGDEVDGARVGIGSVNNGVPYIINEDAVKQYGLIHRIVEFNGIKDPQALKTAAQNYMRNNYLELTSIDITVADISPMDSSLDTFIPGQWVNVYSKNHFTETPTSLLVRKMTIDITNPKNTRMEVGRIKRGITESIAKMI